MSKVYQVPRPLLEGIEWCPTCNDIYQTLFTIRDCKDHQGKEPINRLPVEQVEEEDE